MSHCPLHKLKREQRTLATKLCTMQKKTLPWLQGKVSIKFPYWNPLLLKYKNKNKPEKQEQNKKQRIALFPSETAQWGRDITEFSERSHLVPDLSWHFSVQSTMVWLLLRIQQTQRILDSLL